MTTYHLAVFQFSLFSNVLHVLVYDFLLRHTNIPSGIPFTLPFFSSDFICTDLVIPHFNDSIAHPKETLTLHPFPP